MTATPFGPRPPEPVPNPATGPATQPDPEPAATPAWDPYDMPIRAISPTQPAADRPATVDTDPSMVLDPVPAALTQEQAGQTQPGDADTWWEAPLESAKSQSMLAPMLMSMGVLLGIFIVMRALRRRHANSPVPPPPVERISEIHERAVGSIGPVERAMSEGEQLARRLAATMDNKAARIELLIEEADRKLEELNRAVAAVSRATPASPERATRTPRSIDPTLLDLARVEQDRAERNGFHNHAGDEHRTADRSADRTQSRPPERIAEPPAPEPGTEAGSPTNPVHRRVWDLADSGVPSLEIARSLNQPVGQVELILNLRKSG